MIFEFYKDTLPHVDARGVFYMLFWKLLNSETIKGYVQNKPISHIKLKQIDTKLFC